MAKAGLAPAMHFVETSPVLRAAQAKRIPDATWHDTADTLPTHIPLIVVANEFFDALPIRQLVKRAQWHERMVACQDTLFLPVAGRPVPDSVIPEPLRDAPPGAIIEACPDAVAAMRTLGNRIAVQGGALLAIDYGYEGPAIGETLQAVRGHAPANPFDVPGDQDLTAHVDFATLAAAAQTSGAVAWGPIDQRELLGALGIDQRTATLARAAPDRAEALMADRARLMGDMGTLFRALAVTAPGWPAPAAFA